MGGARPDLAPTRDDADSEVVELPTLDVTGFRESGYFAARSTAGTAGAWQQFVDAFTPLPFGTFGGLPVKILWSVAGLIPRLAVPAHFVTY